MPLIRPHALLFCAVCSFTVTGFAQTNKKVPIELARVELSDGRAFTEVRVRTYDARSDKVLILTDGRAMTLPLVLFPESLHELLKSAPASGGSVSTTPAAPRPQRTSAADQYAMETAVPVSPPPPIYVAQPTVPRRVEPPREASPIRHQFAARARATRHYRYEYQAGSNSISVTALDFEFSAPEPIPGWAGRCRTEGKAYLEFYDSKGRSFQRATSTFEVVTEQRPGEELKVIDFTRKT
jgi:hypothetical protein